MTTTRFNWQGTGLSQVYINYRKSAQKRGHAFRLTKPQFLNLTQRKCHYCGKPPSNKYKRSKPYQGIDRLRNNVGYLFNNCVPCCKECNQLKGTLNYRDFRKIVSKIYNHSIKR